MLTLEIKLQFWFNAFIFQNPNPKSSFPSTLIIVVCYNVLLHRSPLDKEFLLQIYGELVLILGCDVARSGVINFATMTNTKVIEGSCIGFGIFCKCGYSGFGDVHKIRKMGKFPARCNALISWVFFLFPYFESILEIVGCVSEM